MESTIPSGNHSVLNAKLTGSTFTDVCLGEAKFDDVNLAGGDVSQYQSRGGAI